MSDENKKDPLLEEKYIGDGVYMTGADGFSIRLRTQRMCSSDKSNDLIFVEPDMLQNIVNYARDVMKWQIK